VMESLKVKNEITGRHVLYAILVFFLTVTAVDTFMIYKALSTFGGIETHDAYRKGLHYNQRIEADKVQKTLGWTDETKLDSNKEELTVYIRDRDQKGVDGLQITVLLTRPATNRQDRSVRLIAVGSGRYAGKVPGLAEGTWIASLQAQKTSEHGDDILYQSKARAWKAP
jgi:nitrogen fixation protein FixH